MMMWKRRRTHVSEAQRPDAGPEAFTLIETLLSLVLMQAVVFLLAPLSQQLILNDMLWERRLAIRTAEGQLEKACDDVFTFGFNGGLLGGQSVPAADLPPELSGTSGSRNVVCLDGDLSLPDLPQSPINANGSCPSGQQLKRVRITINWTAQSGHSVSYTSADYLISQAGLCGAG